jgi:hypothetical protein
MVGGMVNPKHTSIVVMTIRYVYNAHSIDQRKPIYISIAIILNSRTIDWHVLQLAGRG